MADFRIHQPDGDERGYEFYVNGVRVGSADHDSHGWDGMDQARCMFEKIAKQLNVTVRYTDFDEE